MLDFDFFFFVPPFLRYSGENRGDKLLTCGVDDVDTKAASVKQLMANRA